MPSLVLIRSNTNDEAVWKVGDPRGTSSAPTSRVLARSMTYHVPDDAPQVRWLDWNRHQVEIQPHQVWVRTHTQTQTINGRETTVTKLGSVTVEGPSVRKDGTLGVLQKRLRFATSPRNKGDQASKLEGDIPAWLLDFAQPIVDEWFDADH